MRKKTALRFVTYVCAILVVAAMLITGCSSSAPAPAATSASSTSSAPAASSSSAAAPATSTTQAAAPAAGAAPIEIKAITFLQMTDQRAQLFQELTKLIEKKSNGRITVKFLGGPEVIPAAQFADNLKAGNINLVMTPAAYVEALVPGLSVLAASQLSVEEERKVGFWDKLNEMCAPGGLRFIGRMMPQNDPTVYLGVRNKQITKLDDFKGLKMAYASPSLKDFAESLGMAYVMVPLPDSYTAIDKGTVDVFAAPINDHNTYKWFEVEKSVIDHPFLVPQGCFVMNLPMWNKLGPDLQKVVMDAYLEWEPGSIKAQRDAEAKIKQDLAAKPNLKFVKLQGDDGAKLVQAAYDAEWKRFPKDKAELGQQIKALINKK